MLDSLKNLTLFSVSSENKLLHLSSQDGLTLRDPSVLTTETLIDPEHLVSFLRSGVYSYFNQVAPLHVQNAFWTIPQL